MNDTSALTIPGITDSATLACIARSRKYSQYVGMVEDALAGRCTFCDFDPARNRMIDVPEVNLWRVWHSNSPEKNTALHIIIAPKRHVTDMRQLLVSERDELWRIWDSLPEMFGYEFRGKLVRDGDATQSAGTIEHLHLHEMTMAGTGRVESPFCKTPEEEAAGVVRAIIYEKVRTGTPFESLSPEERALIKGRMGQPFEEEPAKK